MQSIISLLDMYPEAKITLITHEEWVTDETYDLCDKVITDIPNHYRTKMWGLNQSPYDLTLYIDADTEIWHEDIEHIFDEMDDDADFMFTKIRPYAGKITKFPDGEMTLHGGLFLYRMTPEVKEFNKDWYEYYDKQMTNEGFKNLYGDQYPADDLKPWDQFTLWWLLKYKHTNIRIKILKDDARWNFIHLYKEDECEGEIVIWHYTIPLTRRYDSRDIDAHLGRPS